MSGEAEKKEDTPLTEAEVHSNIDADLEKAQDEAFGSDEEISAQAEVEAGTKTQEDVDKELAEKKEAEAEAAKKAEAEKTPEQIEAEAAKKAEAEKTPEQIEADKKAADEAAKKTDEDEDKEEDPYAVPEDMKGRTRDRFEKLTGNLKDAHATVSKQEEVISGFRKVIENTGLSPDEVQKTLNLGALMKSDPMKAREALMGVVSDLSTQLGIPEPGANTLEGFDDLKQQVADREITLEAAREIADGRIQKQAAEKQQKLEDDRRQQADQQKEAAEKDKTDFKTRVEGAQMDVAKHLKTLESEPDYEAAAPRLVDAAKFAAQNLAPEKWLEYIKGEYTKIKEIAGQSAGAKSGDTPILEGGAPPGGKQEPQTHEQLADQML